MGVIFADRVADHPGAFLVAGRRIEAEQPHRPEQAAMDRLQPVANIGQRPGSDRRQGVDEIALGKRLLERPILGFFGQHGIGHGGAISSPIRGMRAPIVIVY
jgi:hypothetical protein